MRSCHTGVSTPPSGGPFPPAVGHHIGRPGVVTAPLREERVALVARGPECRVVTAPVCPDGHTGEQPGADCLASRPRKRAVGGGAKHRSVFVGRLLATLVHLRHAATHDVLACWFGVDRSTITRAVTEVRPLLAGRGCTLSTGRAAADPGRGRRTPRSRREDRDHRRPRDPGPPAGGRTQGPGKVPLRQEQAERGQDHGRHGRGRPRALLRPDQARQLRGHHPGGAGW
ncbi:transposase family protein [Streptomyces sp. KHY 26]|uniref:helix-turn-helix domain-containing protein n=1 Tax=Streptomyces sp. KHY 26 TaxID=3097359 RepID=UPI00376EFFCD